MTRIDCVLAAHELGPTPTDIIVFPEGVDHREVVEARCARPDSVVVAAIVENSHCRGVLLHGGVNRLDYLKVETDGRTQGTGVVPRTPVYEFGDICLGVLICMDIQHGLLFRAVMDKIRSSSATTKLLCIPADMSFEWFSNDTVGSRYQGVAVALCNQTRTYQVRCKSFVADSLGRRLAVQKDVEPIWAQIG
jgi:predicted amidohydrolase